MEKSSCCGRSDLPWDGRGTNLDISGCRFSLYPMSGDFVKIILNALEKTDASKVWAKSDALSSVYRGKLIYVVDALRALFVNAFEENVHIALEGQFSKGCPGDCDGDSFLEESSAPPNLPLVRDKRFPVLCKIALYPLGCSDYIDHIAYVFRMAESAGLKPKTIHYATRIEGDVHKVFDYLQEACVYMQDAAPHYVLTFTLSVNSPTEENSK